MFALRTLVRIFNADRTAYVKLRNAATCGFLWLMLNVQLAARFAPVMHRILHSYAPGNGPAALARAPAARHGTCYPAHRTAVGWRQLHAYAGLELL